MKHTRHKLEVLQVTEGMYRQKTKENLGSLLPFATGKKTEEALIEKGRKSTLVGLPIT